MGLASAAGNIFFVYTFIKRLATPFSSTKAFELGIIDKNGKILKKRSKLKKKTNKKKRAKTNTKAKQTRGIFCLIFILFFSFFFSFNKPFPFSFNYIPPFIPFWMVMLTVTFTGHLANQCCTIGL